jgi:ABC-type hemin transport system ATPase subunit
VFETLAAETATDASAVVVTHDLNLAARFATRIGVLDGGRVAADGDADSVLASPDVERAFGVGMHVGTIPNSGTRFVVPR